jgi:hypothetical protein
MNFFQSVSLNVLDLQGTIMILVKPYVQTSIISSEAASKIWIFHF